jgi:hypothetical protein
MPRGTLRAARAGPFCGPPSPFINHNALGSAANATLGRGQELRASGRTILDYTVPSANYSAITPYLLPAGLPKKVNVGDGFILDSAVKLIGRSPRHTFSSRAPLTDLDVERINETRFLIAAGANTLKDEFELAPGFSLQTLAKIKVPVILLGVGHYGVQAMTQGLSPGSKALFTAFLERFPYISVRCDASRKYVLDSLPERSGNILMTSCPVAYPVDNIDMGFQRKDRYRQLVVTITDRSHLQQQLPILPAAAQLFPAERRILALHQDYGARDLWTFAEGQGYEVFRGDRYQDFIELYGRTDVHFGNRVHAHLKCLSFGVISFCTPFDLRQSYFAESLDFPLIAKLPSPEIAGYDFARAVKRREQASRNMARMLAAIGGLLDAEAA